MTAVSSGVPAALGRQKPGHALKTGLQHGLQAIAAFTLAGVANLAAAQSITSTPSDAIAVPVSGMWVVAAASMALMAVAAYALRGKHKRHGLTLLLVLFMAGSALWNSPALWAQILAQFTQPTGQTLPIPVTPVVVSGALQGFEPADFLNAAGTKLRIAVIDPPDFNDCFPDFPTSLPPPTGAGGPPACAVGYVLAKGTSCRVDVDAICKALATQATSTISVSPTSLTFTQNGTANVTVTTSAVSPQPAHNVAANIPGGSNLSVQSSTCPASLAAGASCTITFSSSAVEGPTIVTVAGSNTATTTLAVTVVANPTISITAPVQASRVIGVGSTTALALTVTNDMGSTVNATNITVIDKAAAPNVVVDDSDCASVAPGASCTLRLTSDTPYAPATLSVGGTNTANTPTTLVAFAHLGGLVFEASGGTGKVVIDAAQQFTSTWTASFSDIAGATSTGNGAANTGAIIADSACFSSPANCAAQRCQNIGADWYLPAVNELASIQGALCSNSALPCNFGGFSSNFYSTSTQTSALGIRVLSMLLGVAATGKGNSLLGRCVRTF